MKLATLTSLTSAKCVSTLTHCMQTIMEAASIVMISHASCVTNMIQNFAMSAWKVLDYFKISVNPVLTTASIVISSMNSPSAPTAKMAMS